MATNWILLVCVLIIPNFLSSTKVINAEVLVEPSYDANVPVNAASMSMDDLGFDRTPIENFQLTMTTAVLQGPAASDLHPSYIKTEPDCLVTGLDVNGEEICELYGTLTSAIPTTAPAGKRIHAQATVGPTEIYST